MKVKKESAWVWFKGSDKGGFWMGGFLASTANEGGVLIERSDFVSCRVPEWRVSLSEPEDLKVGPKIPDNAVWKLI